MKTQAEIQKRIDEVNNLLLGSGVDWATREILKQVIRELKWCLKPSEQWPECPDIEVKCDCCSRYTADCNGREEFHND